MEVNPPSSNQMIVFISIFLIDVIFHDGYFFFYLKGIIDSLKSFAYETFCSIRCKIYYRLNGRMKLHCHIFSIGPAAKGLSNYLDLLLALHCVMASQVYFQARAFRVEFQSLTTSAGY